jgi:hypothetical protein
MYQVLTDESKVERGAVAAVESKYGVTVQVQTLVKESKRNFLNLKVEYIGGTSLLTYMIFKLNI